MVGRGAEAILGYPKFQEIDSRLNECGCSDLPVELVDTTFGGSIG